MKQATHSDERHAAGIIVRYARQHWPELCPTDATVYRTRWYVKTVEGWLPFWELRKRVVQLDVDHTIGKIKQLLQIDGESI